MSDVLRHGRHERRNVYVCLGSEPSDGDEGFHMFRTADEAALVVDAVNELAAKRYASPDDRKYLRAMLRGLT